MKAPGAELVVTLALAMMAAWLIVQDDVLVQPVPVAHFGYR